MGVVAEFLKSRYASPLHLAFARYVEFYCIVSVNEPVIDLTVYNHTTLTKTLVVDI